MSMTVRSLVKTLYALGSAAFVFVAAPAHAVITVADSPLFITVAVAPNIAVTLDDSGSMARAYVPEICDGASSNTCSRLDNRYPKAANYNLLHYDPTVIYPAPKNANGESLTTSFDEALVHGFDSALGTVNLSNNYRPTAFLDLPMGGTASHGFARHYANDVQCRTTSPRRCQVRNASGTWFTGTASCSSNDDCRTRGVPAYYYRYDASNANCNNTATDNDCYDLVVVSDTSGPGTVDLNGDGVIDAADRDERQNFANWYSFARTRGLATQTATSLAFATLDPDVRVGWQALNSCRGSATSFVDNDCDGWRNNFTGISNAIRPFTGTHKQNFYRWLFQLPTDSTTPLPAAMRRAGEYFSTTGENSPYDNDFTTNNSGQLTCRRNYHVMMTDGIWNTAIDIGGNLDGAANRALPATVNGVSTYSARDPYSDAYANTLADVAFRYWATDLAPTLNNNLLPSIRDTTGNDTERFWNPRNDPATWQHMVNFTIGLGLTGFLNEAGLTWDGNMYGGSYPQILANTVQWPNAYSDNNNPANVADLWHAAINSRGRFFSADDPASLSLAFRAALTAITEASGASAALSANSTSLTGTTMVYQAKFNQDWSGTLLGLPVDQNGNVSGTPAWDASTLLPNHASRNIFTYNGSSGVEFTSCSNLSASQRDALNRNSGGTIDNLCEARLAWLRGDKKDEVNSTTSGSLNLFRTRTGTVMGDIINSDPAYVKDVDYGYSGLPAGTPGQDSYEAYRIANANRTAMVYVGSNDGRMYGIRGDAGNPQSGVEQFSYIPGGVYHELSYLTDPSYTHRYFADGSIIARDAYLDGSWRTVVVAGLNAGGRSIYALDVTNPASFSASNVLWEFDATDDPDDLGLTFSRPQIGILENGNWVAIFGNGYNSPNGGAYLYVVDLLSGTLLAKIQASDIAGEDETNGLSTPILIDTDGNKMIDAVYAGDLHGNLWKFDVSGTSAGSWGVANGQPLFSARIGTLRQPITSQPKVAGHPLGGVLVLFGTGRYLANADVFDTSRQSYYGIWDNGTPTTALRANLQQQTFDAQQDIGRMARSVTNNSVNWGAGARGWYLDLVDGVGAGTQQGERVVHTSLIVRDMVIFSSIIPSTDPCTPGGTSWLMALNLINGGEVNRALFDLDNDGEFDSVVDGQSYTALRTDRLGITNVPVLIVEDPTPDDPNDPVDGNDSRVNIGFVIQTGTTGETETNKICLNPAGCGTEPPPTTVRRRSWIQIR
jgi:type IV pilus assembly protein PilY1